METRMLGQGLHVGVEIIERYAGGPLGHGVRPAAGFTAGRDRRYRHSVAGDRGDHRVLGEIRAVPADP